METYTVAVRRRVVEYGFVAIPATDKESAQRLAKEHEGQFYLADTHLEDVEVDDAEA